MRARRVLLLVLAALASVLIAPSVALAVPATFDQVRPASGTTTGTAKPVISVRIEQPEGIRTDGLWMKVDGLTVKHSFAYKIIGTHWEEDADGCGSYLVTDYDYTEGTISYTPKTALANGAHSVTVSVLSNKMTRTPYTWGFNVAQAPVLSGEYPASGSTCDTKTPAISIAAGGYTDGLQTRMLVDGVLVPSSFDPSAGRIVGQLPTPLGNDTEHVVSVSATNSVGFASTREWSFRVQIYPEMPVTMAGCDQCHIGYPQRHPVDNCPACHPSNYSGGAHPDGSFLGGGCTTCHQPAFPEYPQLHLFTDADYHRAPIVCKDCHEASVSVEHYRYTDDSGAAYSCETCHASAEQRVRRAVRYNDPQCPLCHTIAHGVRTVPEVDEAVPLYDAFEWSTPEDARLWQSEPWLPEDMAGGVVLFSNRRSDVTAEQVLGYYRTSMSSAGWDETSFEDHGADGFVLTFELGRTRKAIVRCFSGDGYDISPAGSAGIGLLIVY